MIISHSKKFIFVHIPKTGGSSVEEALAPTLSWSDLILGTTPLGEAMNEAFRERYGLSDHSSVEEIVAICGRELFHDYFSFSLVRHPVDRAVSFYNFLNTLCTWQCRQAGYGLEELRRLMTTGLADDPERAALIAARPSLGWIGMRGFLGTTSFGDFIRSQYTLADPAFFPQIDMVRSLDGSVTLDQIWKLEEIGLVGPRLSRRLEVEITIGVENRSNFPRMRPDEVNQTDRAYLKRLFQEDFLAFDYD
ncbi:sulfotransferase family 2 domain-containing protein [Ostreiculturibacter nitratireducens]|uniref:sulfotransferase family 2 domain-containing protein n=1 Tax=Ostreiculturibacter nitratireducens TaxID=3075226 RepID=UPI0031B5BBF0